MEPKEFNSGDEPFLDWMEKHPEGLVLNINRNRESGFATFQNSQCSHISGVVSGHRPDAHTKHEKIKVGAKESEPLVKWMMENRPRAVGGVDVCGDCEPEIEGLASHQRTEGNGESEPYEESGSTETDSSASQSTKIQMEDFISRVKELEGKTLLTKTGSEYSVHLDDGEVVFELFSERATEKEHPLSDRELRRVLTRFNETGSLNTSDYKKLSHYASYILPILNKIREEWEGSYETMEARDLNEPEQPNRVRREVVRVVRDSTHSRTVKEENDYECQICGETLRLANGERYAEAHHVHPLGEGGVDIPANINHHALLDNGAVRLDPGTIEGVARRYIEYHNEQIFVSQ